MDTNYRYLEREPDSLLYKPTSQVRVAQLNDAQKEVKKNNTTIAYEASAIAAGRRAAEQAKLLERFSNPLLESLESFLSRYAVSKLQEILDIWKSSRENISRVFAPENLRNKEADYMFRAEYGRAIAQLLAGFNERGKLLLEDNSPKEEHLVRIAVNPNREDPHVCLQSTRLQFAADAGVDWEETRELELSGKKFIAQHKIFDRGESTGCRVISPLTSSEPIDTIAVWGTELKNNDLFKPAKDKSGSLTLHTSDRWFGLKKGSSLKLPFGNYPNKYSEDLVLLFKTLVRITMDSKNLDNRGREILRGGNYIRSDEYRDEVALYQNS